MIIRADAIKVREKLSLRPIEPIERECVSVECWYDPHYRHWVLYPVDAEGNQLDEATYDFGKTNALRTKAQMETELIGKTY